MTNFAPGMALLPHSQGVNFPAYWCANKACLQMLGVTADASHRPLYDGTIMRVLVSFEDGLWHAQGIEHDIGASGSTPESAIEKFQVIWKVELALAVEQGKFEGSLLPTYPEGFDFGDLVPESYVPASLMSAETALGPNRYVVDAAL